LNLRDLNINRNLFNVFSSLFFVQCISTMQFFRFDLKQFFQKLIFLQPLWYFFKKKFDSGHLRAFRFLNGFNFFFLFFFISNHFLLSLIKQIKAKQLAAVLLHLLYGKKWSWEVELGNHYFQTEPKEKERRVWTISYQHIAQRSQNQKKVSILEVNWCASCFFPPQLFIVI
jgi:hypothetical protein